MKVFTRPMVFLLVMAGASVRIACAADCITIRPTTGILIDDRDGAAGHAGRWSVTDYVASAAVLGYYPATEKIHYPIFGGEGS
jgi:hypothetical protein